MVSQRKQDDAGLEASAAADPLSPAGAFEALAPHYQSLADASSQDGRDFEAELFAECSERLDALARRIRRAECAPSKRGVSR